MARYGRYVTAGDSDYGLLTASTQRASVYDPMPENGWGHTLNWYGGKNVSGDASPTVRLAAWRTNASMNPTDRLCYHGGFTASAVAGSGPSAHLYSASVANVNGSFSPGSSAIKLVNGQRYSLGFATTSLVGHAMIAAASIPSAGNKQFYDRSSTTTPANPNGYTSASVEGWLSMWIDYQPNRQPVAATTAPTGTISTTTPVVEGTFTDADSTYGDRITLYRIQVYRVSDNHLMWESGNKSPTSTQQANGEFKITYQGESLVAGVQYRWRCMVADDFGTWSAWSSYRTFTVNGGGVLTPSTPSGKQFTRTPGPFLATWNHASALSTNAAQMRIVQGGSTVQESGTIAKSIANGGTVSVSWADTAFTALQWGIASYSWQMRARDTANLWSEWVTVAFSTNAAPGVPTNLSPSNSAASSTRPKLICKGTDADDASLTIKARIKNNSGTVLQTRTMTPKVGTTDTYEYQTLSTDLASFATYRWDAYSFDGNLYSGEQTVEANAAKSAEAVFVYADGPSVTVTSPTDGGSFTSASPTITWSTTGQQKYRVRLYPDGGANPIYDSNQVTSAVSSHTIPSGYIRNGVAYDLIVEATNSAPLTGSSSIVNVTATFPTPASITNFVASAELQRYDVDASSIRLTWDPSTAPSFAEYVITRRVTGDDTELILARITSASISTFVDYLPESGVDYTYSISQSTIVGLDILVSEPATSQAIVSLDHVVLCSIDEAGNLRVGLRLDADRGIAHIDDLVLELPWGSSAPVAFYGTAQYDVFDGSFSLASDDLATARDYISALRALWRSRSTVCYRDERGRKFFAKFSKFNEQDKRIQFYSTDLTLTEVEHFEGVL